MWPRVFFIFFNFNRWKVRCFSLLVVRSLLVVLTIIFLPLSFVTRHRRLALTPSSTLCSIHHCSENCSAGFTPFGFLPWTMFFFYSVTDVISNVAKYNTSVKITDFKNYLKITKYTKKLLNYSNVSKCNSLLYTSVNMYLIITWESWSLRPICSHRAQGCQNSSHDQRTQNLCMRLINLDTMP